MIFQAGIIGPITVPDPISKYSSCGASGGCLILFLNNVIKLVIVVAGLFAFFNIIFAGYAFMSAGDDPKKMAAAWSKIWQSLIGLLIVAASFLLAAIFGYIIFGEWNAILNPTVYGP